MGIVYSYFVKPQDADSFCDKTPEEAKEGDEAPQKEKEGDEAPPPLHPDPPRVSNLSKTLHRRHQTRRNKKKNK